MFHITSQGRRTGKTHKVANTALEFLLSEKDVIVLTFKSQDEIDYILDIIKCNINFDKEIKVENYELENILRYKNNYLKITYYDKIKNQEFYNDIMIIDDFEFLQKEYISKINSCRKNLDTYCYISSLFKTTFNKTCFNIIKTMDFENKSSDKFINSYNLMVKYFGKEKTHEEVVKYRTSIFRLLDEFEIKEILLTDIQLKGSISTEERVYSIIENGYKYINEAIGNLFENKEINNKLIELYEKHCIERFLKKRKSD